MDTGALFNIIFGVLALFFGMALSFAKIDKDRLYEYRHTIPGLALFRFPVWRWGIVVILFITGFVSLAFGFKWL